jgi:16S rRNA processing protein RimM
VLVGGVPREIADVAGTAERPILAFVGIESRETATELARQDIRVAPERLPALDGATFYVRDLIGCTVLEGERELGVVVEVESAPANDLLVVDGEAGPLLVALVEETVRGVDLESRTISVREGRAVVLPGGA